MTTLRDYARNYQQNPVIIAGTDDEEFHLAHVDNKGQLLTKILLWNTESLDWEASTKGSGVGEAVSVENFPAVISGSAIPITSDDPTAKYKITDIDSTEGNSYFGYVDKDGGWYMMNLTATAARYAKGISGYAAAWGAKGDQNWGYFNEIF